MYDNWEELENSIKNCNKCKLCSTRKSIVFGEGNKQADLMFIGEGPGADEDTQGTSLFVGKSRTTYEYGFSRFRYKKTRSIYNKYS